MRPLELVTKPLKIAHVVYSCIPNNYRGGIAKIVFELSQAQVALGHQVTIYTTNVNSGVVVEGLADNITQGVSLRYFRRDNSWYESKALKLALSKADADVIHCHNTFLALNLYGAQISRRYQIPLFFHTHGALDPLVVNSSRLGSLKKNVYIRLIERRNLQTAASIFANSEQEKEQIQYWGVGVPIAILPNGINIPSPISDEERARAREEFKIGNDRKSILFVGRIVEKKGLHLLLQAVGELAEQGINNLEVLIVGDKEQDKNYSDRLKQLVEKYKLDNSIRWLGHLTSQQLRTAYAGADLFSHVSKSEGMAMSILESLANGLPTLISPGCYMQEAVKNGAAIECSYDPNSIRETLRRFAEGNHDFWITVGENGRRYVATNHSWNSVAEESISVYQRFI